nr:RNA-directed DNA polymerase, eukaryota, reverse transcriptase zinc-binding domain protein [Tanacetum cinerariifolium]
MPYLISDVQSAFVANHQIIDGPFIFNELLSWCKFKKLNGMIFKVDFEKAFDSVKWDYLDETLKAFGFGSKWCNWISSCLNNAMGSVLVNGSPTLEFQFHKGLKQGLKINLHKSKLMGIGVSSNVVAAATSLIGCYILTAPFKYLGVKVGSNMSRITSWDDVIFKVWTLFHMVGMEAIQFPFEILQLAMLVFPILTLKMEWCLKIGMLSSWNPFLLMWNGYRNGKVGTHQV